MSGKPRPKRYRLRTLQDLFRLPPDVVNRAMRGVADAVHAWQQHSKDEDAGFPVELTYIDDGYSDVLLSATLYDPREVER